MKHIVIIAVMSIIMTNTFAAVKIDGALSEPEWKNAQKFTFKAGDPSFDVTALVLWDEAYFYFACTMPDPTVEGKHKSGIQPVWEDNGIEFYLETDQAKFEGRSDKSFQLLFSAAGAYNDTSGKGQGGNGDYDFAWDSRIEYAVALEPGTTLNNDNDQDKGWRVEARLPWSDMNVNGRTLRNMAMGWNVLYVNRDGGTSTAFSWSPDVTGFANNHIASNWGKITFVQGYVPVAPPVIEYVNVGNPGNKADAPQQGGQFGAVGYAYQIGKFKVTVAQYAAFLNARAASDPHGLFNENMEITREGGDGSYTYTVQAGKANRPIRWVEPVDCLRFCNWLHNGGQANSDTETGAYRFSTPETPGPRSVGAKVFLPTEDEWYKAAYYDPTKGGTGGYWKFAVKADDTVADLPPGGPRSANFDAVNRDDGGTTDVGAYRSASSYYGTFDQTGNVWEWLEPASAAPDMSRRRSGSWENAIGRLSSDQTGVSALGVGGTQHQGFRVGAAVGIVPPRPTLTITRSGDNLEIVWPAGARLESATAVQGPWSAVANVSSPLRLKPDAARRFYRSSQ